MITVAQINKAQKNANEIQAVLNEIADITFTYEGFDNEKIYIDILANNGEFSTDELDQIKHKTRLYITEEHKYTIKAWAYIH